MKRAEVNQLPFLLTVTQREATGSSSVVIKINTLLQRVMNTIKRNFRLKKTVKQKKCLCINIVLVKHLHKLCLLTFSFLYSHKLISMCLVYYCCDEYYYIIAVIKHYGQKQLWEERVCLAYTYFTITVHP